MKIVYIQQGRAKKAQEISESDARNLANSCVLEEKKSKYEFIRGKLGDKRFIIYKENKITRTKNSWYETRSLAKLSELLNIPFNRNKKLNWKGFETEVDGVSLDNDIGVEIKYKKINKTELSHLEKKIEDLGFSKLILVAKGFETNLSPSKNTILYRMKPDWNILKQYYKNNFKLWYPVKTAAVKRHFRFLLSNGRWLPQFRRYTVTAKWSFENRLFYNINQLYKFRKYPIKIYYSLSTMINPLGEFEAQGYPIPHTILAMDIDGSHSGPHIIDNNTVCKLCQEDADKKLKEFIKNIEKEYEFTILQSGSKGYHVYFLDKQGMVVETSWNEMAELSKNWSEWVDPFISKNKGEFDNHRIFKVPYTVDASTGRIVSEITKSQKLEFNDSLIEIS